MTDSPSRATASRAAPASPSPGHACQVFAADDIWVSAGANMGDGLGLPDEVESGDIYQLEPGARPARLVLTHPEAGADPRVGEGSAVGRPGDPVATIARYTLMADDGDRIEILLLQVAGGLYVLPLSPVSERAEYTLLTTDTTPGDIRLSELMCLSFARGTGITLADGRQVAVENLEPGMKILTRDHGPQVLRLVGRATLRAVGVFAPVVITAGTLGNSGDLIVSQHHRMFLYQRHRVPGLATSELLVQARWLADGERVFIREGGFTDWFSLIFDHHEIIYAEGIPAESLMVNDATISRLPPELAAEVQTRFPGLAQVQHFGTEAGRQFLETLGGEALYPARTRGGPGR
ncbi:Hint domain-containing protein [Pseudogemmobacter humi]|uniref:Hedgehog/Intein (Hint) domain-containing protein n=1 Tax=Pseudogemmobacter humi TaxID=2483812 RepID=A0A3P5WS09_9RHOB|nr:Hint domain-containing protein [Pseudogemmobacter humi]VDC24478.1 hypothetical protein XINFAN_01210 [Pseudogemmobacter humi]